MRTIKSIIDEYKRRTYKLPDYIHQSDKSDFMIYSRYRLVLDNILLLAQPDFLSEEDVMNISNHCNKVTDDIFSYMDVLGDLDRIIMLREDINSFIDDLSNELLENEHFEALVNVREYKNLYYTLWTY